MEFKEYLLKRHEIMKGERQIQEKSADQYINRLKNLQNKKIYNGEKHVDEQMLAKIHKYYKDTTNHYPRTIKYYIEFLNHSSQAK